MNHELSLDLVQSSVLAGVLLILGEFARRRVGFLQRFSIPGPVIGGFLFALLLLVLRQADVATVEFDTTLQEPAMIAFFTTVGLTGSLSLVRKGGRLLIVYLLACWTLAVVQNLVGIGLAEVLGVNPLLGIMAGAVSLEGGHGAAAAFGPTAEAMGAEGATAVAVASATFGLVAGSVLGGPLAGWLMKRGKVRVPTLVTASTGSTTTVVDQGSDTGSDSGSDTGRGPETENAEESGSAGYRKLLSTGVLVGVIMVLGTLLGTWFSDTTGFVLPGYVGAMVVAVVFRNLNDRFGWVRLDSGTVDLISGLTLGFFLTMAMMSLKIWELYALALPLVVILAVQVLVLVVFVAFVVFRLLGGNYDAATMAAGMMGHGLGGTPNAMANMDAFNSRFGVRSERAFLVVPLAGAVLIDLVGLPWIVWCMNWVG
ncbi:ESS family glutamate:Na+ symporter [Murinocardiopsis flavida]|uniref:Sodium/glutamate symporter n=1 Tax=Murinocardiopsis flavida TaxID=645275 RepID=A0A2P8D3T0_9ACTN|nr:sodium/glutamate symporter [Murinocardiopsis flavida]PSK91866.1 ESS family glutamate:Na+ symporter [Murinocardiopsis flavida]